MSLNFREYTTTSNEIILYVGNPNLEKLEEDRKTFAKEYAEKMSNLN